jgi:hypothetical protein
MVTQHIIITYVTDYNIYVKLSIDNGTKYNCWSNIFVGQAIFLTETAYLLYTLGYDVCTFNN